MKICYIDESVNKTQTQIVVATIMIDALRMNKTKSDWAELRQTLSEKINIHLDEIHTTNLYRGLKEWESVSQSDRFQIIDDIVNYINGRKHKILFSAVDLNKLVKIKDTSQFASLLECDALKDKNSNLSIYKLACLHLALCVQKLNCHIDKNKGSFLLIFDHKDHTIIDLIWNPPNWAHQYYLSSCEYQKIEHQQYVRLPDIVDVPYHADSKRVLAINIADFYAYFICLYASLKNQTQKPDTRFNEMEYVTTLIKKMSISFVSDSNRWPTVGRNICQDLFYQIAPDGLLTLKKDMENN